MWFLTAATVKRLHDRDKSGWWIIPYFVYPGLYCQFQDRLPDSWLMFPLALAAFGLIIAGFVDLYCLKGTRWTNRFGARSAAQGADANAQHAEQRLGLGLTP